MAAETVVLITGANRGIGRALADAYLARPNHTIIAFVRDTISETSKSLITKTSTYCSNSSVILIPYDASLATAAETAISTLTASHSEITHIDTVVANAGFISYMGSSTGTTHDVYTEHFATNTLAPIFLLKSVLPLLRASASPKFIAISSAAGSIAFASTQRANFDTEGNLRRGAPCYGASKIALNYLIVRADIENRDVVFGLYTPGPTKTGFGRALVNWDVIPGAMDVDTVVKGLVDQFDGLEKVGIGELRLKDWRGSEIPW